MMSNARKVFLWRPKKVKGYISDRFGFRVETNWRWLEFALENNGEYYGDGGYALIAMDVCGSAQKDALDYFRRVHNENL